MAMHLVAVNRSMPEHTVLSGRDFFTAIRKVPATGPVTIGALGLAGDGIGSPQHHGGHDQAIYAYGTPDYDWWAEQLGRPMEPGTFGENLTIDGLRSADLAIGDRLVIGAGVTVEVTAPRIPCGTLAARMLDGEFVKRFRAGRRPGAYARVIEAGVVEAGEPVRLVPAGDRSLALVEMFDLAYRRDLDEATIRRVLAAPVAERARNAYERMARTSGP